MITFPKLGRNGRFGNQLFQIASTIGIARKLNYRFGFPQWIHRGDSLTNSSKKGVKDGMQKYFVNQLPKWPWYLRPKRRIDVPWGYHEITCEDGVGINGYLQSIRYFDHCQDEIRHYFSLKKILPYTPPSNSVAVHIRRGDYDGDFHVLLDEEYYRKAISLFPASSNFIVFSDDIEFSKRLLGNKVTYAQGSHFIEDFYMMTQCEHFITANSTYSWWAAYLGDNPDKQVVAPKVWFGPKGESESPESPHQWLTV